MFLLMPTLADRARGKEDSKKSFLNEYEMVAKPIIENMRQGLFYDSSLMSANTSDSTGRNVEVFSNDTLDNTVDFISDMETFYKSFTI